MYNVIITFTHFQLIGVMLVIFFLGFFLRTYQPVTFKPYHGGNRYICLHCWTHATGDNTYRNYAVMQKISGEKILKPRIYLTGNYVKPGEKYKVVYNGYTTFLQPEKLVGGHIIA